MLLAAGGLLINRVYWKNRYYNKLAEIRKAGYPTNCQELDAWYKQVPVDENAANIVLAAADRLVIWKDRDVPWCVGYNFGTGGLADLASGKASEVYIDIPPDDSDDQAKPRTKPLPGHINWPTAKEVKKQGLPDGWDKKNNRLLPYLGDIVEVPQYGGQLGKRVKLISEEFLRENKWTLQQLHRLLSMDTTKSHYPCNLSTGYKVRLNHLGSIKECSGLVALQALVAIDNNNINEAINDIIINLKLPQTLSREPIIVSYLVAISIEGRATENLQQLFNRVTLNDKQLQRLDKNMAATQKALDNYRMYRGNLCILLNLYDNADRAFVGLIRKNQYKYGAALVIDHVLAIDDMDKLAVIGYIEQFINTRQLPYNKARVIYDKITQQLANLSVYHFLIRAIIPSFDSIDTLSRRIEAKSKLARTAIAIERYRLAHGGQLPGILSDLVPEYMGQVPLDPFSAKPIIYKKLSKGYMVYSIGINGRDDNGKASSDKDVNEENCDIVFRVNRCGF